MTDLGTLAGGAYSSAYGINDHGQVVGESNTASGENHAFLWTAENGMIDLGTLDGGIYSWASGINNQGQVVGFSYTSTWGERAFLWEDGVMTHLEPLAGTESGASAINNLGQIAGQSSTAGSFTHAVLWTPALNGPPVADPDNYSTNEDAVLNIAAPGVLDGDMDVDGDDLTAVLDTSTSNGGLTFSSDGSFSYTPDADYCGLDSFTYHANDGTADSNVATVSIEVVCVNDPPETSVDHDAVEVYEGETATNSGSFSDIDSDSISLSASAGTVLDDGNGTWSWSLGTTDGPAENQTVTITVDDGTDSSGVNFVLTVNNVAPTVETITVPVDPVAIGDQPVNTSATFSDPAGASDMPYTCTINYGDGSGDLAGIVSDNACTGPDHSYDEPGVYTVSASITDKDLASGSGEATEFIVIYDPDGGFVTGGGWIDSPEGAFTADPSLTGKANFGFVSKYKKGADTPTGNTEFLFKAGDLNFHSSDYDWLVVAGPQAKFKGIGTINGTGEYGFMLSAVDGQVNGGGGTDKFRIKIWDKATEAVVYDNQLGAEEDVEPTTALGGGSIVIHTRK